MPKKFRPIEVIARSHEEFDALPLKGGVVHMDLGHLEEPRYNPRRRRAPEFMGLKVRIVLVHDADYDSSVKVQIRTASDVFALMEPLRDEAVETFWTIVLNTKLRVVGVCEIARGQIDGVAITPADVLRPVLAAGANRCIIVHNHPSGEAAPSPEDHDVTNRVVKAAKLLGMVVLDHCVVSRGGIISFNERGWM